MSKLEENKALVRRWFDMLSSHDVEGMCAMTSREWRMHGGPPNLPVGPDGIRTLLAGFGHIKQTWTVEDMIAEGDKVVVRGTNTCLQDSFFGVPTHGRWQKFTATFTLHMVDGMVRETWRNADDLGRVLQLGARIQPGEAPA